MKRFMHLTAGLLAVSFLFCSTAPAQIPANTAYVGLVSSLGSSTKTKLFGFDAQGKVTTVVSFPGPTPRQVAEIPGQNALMVWGPTGNTVYDMRTGTTVSTTLTPAGDLNWAYIDEDLGMVWANGWSDVFKSDDLKGTHARRLARLPGISGVGAWNGTTGGFAATLRSGFNNDIGFYDRRGNLVTRAWASLSPSGLSWSPWGGDMLLAQISGPSNGDLDRVSQQGVKTPIPLAQGPLSGMTYDAEVLHQPSERFLCVKSLSNPDYLFRVAPTGAATTITPVKMQMLEIFVDVIALGQRSLWGAGPWSPGQVGRMIVDFGPAEAGRVYQVALSFGHRPGISFGAAGTAHVVADDLFWLSLQEIPGLFGNFRGVLDANGRAPSAPTVNVPRIEQLRGLRVFGSCVVLGTNGVQKVSNAWGITID